MKLKAAVKLAAGLLILALLVRYAGPSRVLDGIAAVGWRTYLIALVLFLTGQLVCSVRWHIIARSLGISEPFWKYPLLYVAGLFMNLFLPTAVGGDLGKGLLLSGKDGWSRGVVSALGDRVAGVAVLSIVLFAGLAGGGRFLPRPAAASLKLFPLAVAAALAGAAVASGRIRIRRWPAADEAVGHVAAVLRGRRAFGRAMAVSVVFYAIHIALHVVVGRSLGIGISVADFAVIATVTGMASMIPVSPGGLGVREGSYQLLLSLCGVPAATGLAFGMALLAVNLLLSLLGGLLLYGMVVHSGGFPLDFSSKTPSSGL